VGSPLEGERLAAAEAGVDQELEEQAVAGVAGSLEKDLDLFGREVLRFLDLDLGTRDRSHGVLGELAVLDGSVEDSAQDRVGVAPGGVAEPLAAEFRQPPVDRAWPHPVHRRCAERAADDVVAGDGGVHRLGARLAVRVRQGRLDPGLGVLVDELAGVAGRQLLLQSGPDLLCLWRVSLAVRPVTVALADAVGVGVADQVLPTTVPTLHRSGSFTVGASSRRPCTSRMTL